MVTFEDLKKSYRIELIRLVGLLVVLPPVIYAIVILVSDPGFIHTPATIFSTLLGVICLAFWIWAIWFTVKDIKRDRAEIIKLEMQ